MAVHIDQCAQYFVILLCLIPGDFTCQVESAATQRVNIHNMLLETL